MNQVAAQFCRELILDLPPSSPAALTDFGLDRPNHKDVYAAYQDGIRSGQIKPEELSDAICNGGRLTDLVRRVNPSLMVKTVYDSM